MQLVVVIDPQGQRFYMVLDGQGRCVIYTSNIRLANDIFNDGLAQH